VDVESESVTLRRDFGSFVEVPFYVTNDGFSTLQRKDNQTFVMLDVGFDGKVQRRKDMPLFHNGYRGDTCAFSEDGNKVAYIKSEWFGDRGSVNYHRVSRLSVCSIQKPTVNLLPAGVCDNLLASCGYRVMWVDSNSILLYPDVGYSGRKNKEYIRMLSLSDMRICNLLEVYGSSCGPLFLSPSKRYLLASEDVSGSTLERLHIIDLKAEKEIAVITPKGEGMPAHGAVWSADDEIVYSVDNRVYMQKICSQQEKEVFRVNPKYGDGAWLYAVDSKRNLHYERYQRINGCSEPVDGWRTFNLDTKEEKKLMGKHISGKVLMNGKRNKIVAEVE
jgi:hypothetical protein